MWNDLSCFLLINGLILIEFNSISDGYPLKMKLSFSGEAQKHQGANGGTFILQEDKINNKVYWIHQSGYRAIWWDNNFNKWKVGAIKYLGSEFAGIKGPSNNDIPPNQITNGWKYTTGNQQWPDTNDVLFEDCTFKQGKFLHFLCKNLFHREQTKFKQMFHF